MLIERSHTQKVIYYIIPNGHRDFFGGDENVLELEVVVAKHCECTKCHYIIHFKMVPFTLCEFHFNNRDEKIKKASICFVVREAVGRT